MTHWKFEIMAEIFGVIKFVEFFPWAAARALFNKKLGKKRRSENNFGGNAH
jgi:hypothetical protein